MRLKLPLIAAVLIAIGGAPGVGQTVPTPQQVDAQLRNLNQRIGVVERELATGGPVQQLDARSRGHESALAKLRTEIDNLKTLIKQIIVLRGAWAAGTDPVKGANAVCFRRHGYAVLVQVSSDPDPRGSGIFFTCQPYEDVQ